jgi:large subunit ribosomal protein L24
MASSLNVHRGDRVKVISGKDAGKEGKVLRAFPEKQRVVVEGVNKIKKHTRPTQKQPQGGILEIEGSIHVSNVMLVCPSCGEPTRVGHKREDGTRLRVCKRCDKQIEK